MVGKKKWTGEVRHRSKKCLVCQETACDTEADFDVDFGGYAPHVVHVSLREIAGEYGDLMEWKSEGFGIQILGMWFSWDGNRER